MALVEKSSPPFLFKHCLRSYAFGIAMAHKVKRKIDNEVFFLGAIMHDLGLTDDFSGENTFEVVGAQAARNFCVNNAINNNKADLIHEMVALHNSVGLAHKLDPEIALLHFGAGADVAGLWIGDIHKRTLEEILSRYSNKGCKEGMINLIHDQVIKKPNSYMATMVELGFLKKMAKVSF
ncbi:MAG: HD domain-containing protein [Spongiibacteraceae bacterium]|nr:HD domain-containing protein [Spongiibacteraceae bacterium]